MSGHGGSSCAGGGGGGGDGCGGAAHGGSHRRGCGLVGGFGFRGFLVGTVLTAPGPRLPQPGQRGTTGALPQARPRGGENGADPVDSGTAQLPGAGPGRLGGLLRGVRRRSLTDSAACGLRRDQTAVTHRGQSLPGCRPGLRGGAHGTAHGCGQTVVRLLLVVLLFALLLRQLRRMRAATSTARTGRQALAGTASQAARRPPGRPEHGATGTAVLTGSGTTGTGLAAVGATARTTTASRQRPATRRAEHAARTGAPTARTVAGTGRQIPADRLPAANDSCRCPRGSDNSGRGDTDNSAGRVGACRQKRRGVARGGQGRGHGQAPPVTPSGLPGLLGELRNRPLGRPREDRGRGPVGVACG
jgi:hypothetical protein